MILENWRTILSSVIGIGHIIFGLYVFFRNKEKNQSKIFLISALSMAVWLLSMAIITSGLVQSKEVIIILDRITFAVAPTILITIALYLKDLMTDHLSGSVRKDKVFLFLCVFGFIVTLLTPTDLISANPGVMTIVPGKLMLLLAAFVVIATVYIAYLGIHGYKTTEGETKEQIKYLIIGVALSAIGVLTLNLIPPAFGYPAYPELGAASTIFIVLMMGLGVTGSYILGAIAASIGLFILILVLVSIIFAAALFFFLIFLGIVLNR